MLKQPLTFFHPDSENNLEIPFVGDIKAGFPSPAADFEDDKISLDKVLVKNHEATFYAKANGNSMTRNSGIQRAPSTMDSSDRVRNEVPLDRVAR